VGVVAAASDSALRGLRDNDRWTAAVKTFTLQAHWIDGEPLDDVQTITKIEDRHRSFVVDGAPVATGVVAVGDSWACTNPSVGRGATIGLLHAVALRDLLREASVDDPIGLAQSWDAATQATVEDWYRSTLHFDRHRLAEAEAAARGQEYRPDDPVWDLIQALQYGVGQDPDLLRGFLSIAGLLRTADEVMAQPGLLDKVIALGQDWRSAPVFGPSRDELVAIARG
jgi:2-polyprenyl-6-methoxyphenol hydroxylase-like FAD-dependent oxidoreductase